MTAGLATLILFGIFAVLLMIGVPIAISIAVSALATAAVMLPADQAMFVITQKLNTGLESFTLLAIPLFVLAGNIMNSGGIAGRLIRLAQLITGRIPGSLAQTNVMGNMLFGALSGSAVAAAAAIGGTMQREQRRQNYDPAFSAAANIASAPSGLLIPPTTAFIVFSMISGGVSISALFMAGVLPGVLMGLAAMAVALIFALRHGYKGQRRSAEDPSALRVILDAIPSLLLIVIVVGGIVTGIFTATEGAGIAVAYCLLLALIYRGITWRSARMIMERTISTTGVILFLIAASSAMSWVMAYTGIPAAISEALLSVSDSPAVILLLMIVVLLLVGTFMDITPAILIFTPILLPIAENMGMDPVHFGVVLIFAMCIGTMTPPVGSVLFVGVSVGGTTLEKVIPKLVPYLIAMVAVLLLVSYVPLLSLGLPGMMGLL